MASNRRQYLALLGCMASLPMLPSCTLAQQPVTVGQHVWPGYDPSYLAKELGWLDQQRVTLVQTSSSTETLALLEKGEIDCAALTLDEVLRVREKGTSLSVILVYDISAGADQFVTRSDISALRGIRGKRIAVEEGGLGALMLDQVLLAAGLRSSDIKPISMSVDKQPDAWKLGQIDAAVSYEPIASELRGMGAKSLFDSSSLPDLIVDVLVVRTTLMDYSHDDALRHLVTSHLKGLHYLNTNSGDAALRLAPRYKLPSNQVMGTFRGLILPDLVNNIRLLASSPSPLMKSASTVSEVLQRSGILSKPADLSDLIDARYLPNG